MRDLVAAGGLARGLPAQRRGVDRQLVPRVVLRFCVAGMVYLRPIDFFITQL